MKVVVVYYTINSPHPSIDLSGGRRRLRGEGGRGGAPEPLPIVDLKRSGASEEVGRIFTSVHICTPEELEEADAAIFGTPVYFGNISGQMPTFLDSLGELWKRNTLVGKVGSVFVSSGSQHGGQKAAVLSFHPTLFHLGMIIVGLPYSFKSQRRIDEVAGGSPYGASTIVGMAGERMPSETKLAGAGSWESTSLRSHRSFPVDAAPDRRSNHS